jgi:hypothetical protein
LRPVELFIVLQVSWRFVVVVVDRGAQLPALFPLSLACVSPREGQCFSERIFVYSRKDDAGAAAATPGAGFGAECLRMVFDECRLLVGRQLDHPARIVWMQGRKDPLVDAKVGMPHVRAFPSALEAEGNFSEALSGDWRGHEANSATRPPEHFAGIALASQDCAKLPQKS